MSDVSKRVNDPIGWLVDAVIEYGFETIFRRYYGKYRGIVVDVHDPLKLGRVRVMIPDIGQVKPEDVSSNVWAIPSGQMGGSFGDEKEVDGWYNPPENGDFVWIEFERGDVNMPVYTKGIVLENKPKGTNDLWEENNLIKGIRTKAGHILKFMNKAGQEAVSLVWGKDGKQSKIKVELTKDGVDITTENSKINVTENKITLQNKQSTKIELENNDILVKSATGSITMNSMGMKVATKGILEMSGSQIILNSNTVLMGKKGAYEPVIQGGKFAALYARHIHALNPTLTATLPPVEPIIPGNGLSINVLTR